MFASNWLDDGTILVSDAPKSVIPAQACPVGMGAGIQFSPSVKSVPMSIGMVSQVKNPQDMPVLQLAEFGTAADSNSKPHTETVYDDNGKISAQIVYDANGNITLFAMYLDDGSKVVITTAYDKDGNQTSNICTTYDAQGNVVSREDMPLVTETTASTESVIPNEREESVYSASSSFSSEADLWLLEADLMGGRMMMMSAPSGPMAASEVFTYDHLGNRYQYTGTDGLQYTFLHNAVNQYQKAEATVFNLTMEKTWSHDDNGNLEMDENGRTYFYDYRNRLTEIKDAEGNSIAKYTYDALGRRIKKVADGQTTYYFYDTQGRVIAEYKDDTLDRTYVWGNGQTEILAMFLYEKPYSQLDVDLLFGFFACWLTSSGGNGYNDAYDYVNDNKIDLKDWAVLVNRSWNLPEPATHETRLYYLADALGSIRGLIGGRLNREEDREFYNYDVYGSSSDSSVAGNPFRFAGYRLDTESGLYLLEKRSYEPAIGRFLQLDPTGYADSMNLYEYAMSNPIMFTDPTGEACSTRAEARQKAIEDVERKAYRNLPMGWIQDGSKWGGQFGDCVEAVYFKLKRDCKPAEIPNEKGYTDEYDDWDKVERLSGKPEFPNRVDADISEVGSIITNASNTNRLRPFPGVVPGQIVGVSIDGGTRIPVGGKGYNNVPGLFPNSGPIKTMNIGKMHRVTWKIFEYWRRQQYYKGFYVAKKECTTETLLRVVYVGGSVYNTSAGTTPEVFKSKKFRFKEKGTGQREDWELSSVTNYGFTPTGASETWMFPPQ